jgi:hypothetical protein
VAQVHVRTLKRAAAIVGGEEALALRLRATPSHLALWLAGAEPPPLHIFLRAVDLVTEHAFPMAQSAEKTSEPLKSDPHVSVGRRRGA